MSYRGVNNTPLTYIIWQKPKDTTITTGREVEIIYGALLVNTAFNADNIKFYGIINQLTLEKNANNWIKLLNYKNEYIMIYHSSKMKKCFNVIKDGDPPP